MWFLGLGAGDPAGTTRRPLPRPRRLRMGRRAVRAVGRRPGPDRQPRVRLRRRLRRDALVRDVVRHQPLARRRVDTLVDEERATRQPGDHAHRRCARSTLVRAPGRVARSRPHRRQRPGSSTSTTPTTSPTRTSTTSRPTRVACCGWRRRAASMSSTTARGNVARRQPRVATRPHPLGARDRRPALSRHGRAGRRHARARAARRRAAGARVHRAGHAPRTIRLHPVGRARARGRMAADAAEPRSTRRRTVVGVGRRLGDDPRRRRLRRAPRHGRVARRPGKDRDRGGVGTAFAVPGPAAPPRRLRRPARGDRRGAGIGHGRAVRPAAAHRAGPAAQDEPAHDRHRRHDRVPRPADVGPAERRPAAQRARADAQLGGFHRRVERGGIAARARRARDVVGRDGRGPATSDGRHERHRRDRCAGGALR